MVAGKVENRKIYCQTEPDLQKTAEPQNEPKIRLGPSAHEYLDTYGTSLPQYSNCSTTHDLKD